MPETVAKSKSNPASLKCSRGTNSSETCVPELNTLPFCIASRPSSVATTKIIAGEESACSELFAGLYRLFFGTSSEANAEGSYAPSAVGLEEKQPMVRVSRGCAIVTACA